MRIRVKIKKKLGDFKLDIDFTGESGRIGILGASGCGKSMTLKCIAGIETPDEGEIYLNGAALFDSKKNVNVPPQKRNIGYLFQNYALFPTMTVAENIGAGLRGKKEDKKERIRQMIEKFRLSGLENRLPAELSGGQQQRVALARIMAYQPGVILLDEPFSALDVFLRDQLQRELKEMLADYEGLVIMVSHSRDEIYRFGEELLIIDQGRKIISGETKKIFEDPVYREAARLTGCKNFSNVRKTGKKTILAVDWGVELTLAQEIPDDITCIGYRAHDFVPVWGERPENAIRVRVTDIARLPFEDNYYLEPEWEEEERENKERESKKEKRRGDYQPICWFVQQKWQSEIERRGLPDYLEMKEENLMLLKDR